MTNGQIDRLGQRISQSRNVSSEDLDMLQEFRKSYSDALSHMFEAIKEAAVKVDEKTIVTFRIKRIDTIIRKLQRFADSEHGKMKLSRMWDIAGCRCILFNLIEDKIYKLADEISEIEGITEKTDGNDYVYQAKPDGYRSYHMYVEHKDFRKPIEIQIRNKTMHTWATLVEIFDIPDFEKAAKEIDPSPEQMDKMLAILDALDQLPEVVKTRNEKSEPRVTINNTQLQSQSQSQNVMLKVFIEALHEELSGKQIRELKEIAEDTEIGTEEKKSSILDKIKEFGKDTLASIVANVLTNPAIWGMM